MVNRKVFIVLWLVFSLAPFAYADAPDTSTVADNPNKALGQVQFSAYASTEKSEEGLFTTDFILPLYYSSSKDTLLYYNPKDTYSTPHANEIHQGVGIRHIFDDSFILGMNTFFDRRQDNSDAWFSQAGVGLEYLSHPLDMRLNWYKPTTGDKIVNTTYGFGSTDLIRYDQREEPLQGLDFELGVPVFDKYTKTRVYLGGYFYQSKLSKDVNGFRARSETSLTKWLSLDTTLNSNINKRVEFYGGLRVSLAFDLSNLLGKHGKVFFSAPSYPDSNNTYLEDRIFDRVVRDIDIQSKAATTQSDAHDMIYVNNANTGFQNGSLQYPYETIQEGVNAASGGKWVFVEQGLSQNSSPTFYAGDISLTNSVVLWGSGYNGGFNGLAVSGEYPVIDATSNTNGITLANANTVMGLQIQNATNDGIVFTNGITLTGTIKYNYITGNTNNGIEMTENNGAMTDFIISNNIVNNSGNDGIDLAFNGLSGTGTMTGFVITNNTFNGNVFDGLDFSYNGEGGSGTMSDFTISNNTGTNNGNDGIEIGNNGFNGNGAISNIVISNNTLTNNSTDGLSLAGNGNDGTGTMTGIVISNNNFNNNINDGMDLSGNGSGGGNGTMTDVTISSNTSNSNGNDGIDLSHNADAGSGTMTGFTISNNTANSNTNDGIDLSYNAHNNTGTMTNFTISNNTTSDSGHDGIDLSYNGDDGVGNGTMTGFTIFNNTSINNTNDGIDLSLNGYQNGTGTMSDFTISHNVVNGNSYNGIDLGDNGLYGTGIMTGFTISNNTSNSNGSSGISLLGNGVFGTGTMTNFIISNNVTNYNANDGIDLSHNGIYAHDGFVFGSGGAMTNFTLSNNTVDSNDANGIDLSYNGYVGPGTMTGFTFSSNSITNNSQDGIIFSNSSEGSMSSINLGDSTSGGHNSIYANNTSNGGYYDLYNNSAIDPLPAEYNWWGQAGGPVAGQIGGPNSVDSAHSLNVNPN